MIIVIVNIILALLLVLVTAGSAGYFLRKSVYYPGMKVLSDTVDAYAKAAAQDKEEREKDAKELKDTKDKLAAATARILDLERVNSDLSLRLYNLESKNRKKFHFPPT